MQAGQVDLHPRVGEEEGDEEPHSDLANPRDDLGVGALDPPQQDRRDERAKNEVDADRLGEGGGPEDQEHHHCKLRIGRSHVSASETHADSDELPP